MRWVYIIEDKCTNECHDDTRMCSMETIDTYEYITNLDVRPLITPTERHEGHPAITEVHTLVLASLFRTFVRHKYTPMACQSSLIRNEAGVYRLIGIRSELHFHNVRYGIDEKLIILKGKQASFTDVFFVRT